MVHNTRRKIALEHRQKLRANSGSEATQIGVGCVFAPGLAEVREVFAKRAAANHKQRPDDRCSRANDGIDAPETGRARAANQVGHDRFGLVVRSVCHGDACGAASVNHTLKECVPEPASRVFDVPIVFHRFCRDILALEDQLQAASAREVGNKPHVPIGFIATQSMIEMYDRQCDAELARGYSQGSAKARLNLRRPILPRRLDLRAQAFACRESLRARIVRLAFAWAASSSSRRDG